jgi:acetoin utilization deacetylase AcuC-like enzyme
VPEQRQSNWEIFNALLNGKAMSDTVLIFDQVFLKHEAGKGHPESPSRLESIVQGLKADPLTSSLPWIQPRPASAEEILFNHTRQYVSLVRRKSADGSSSLGFPDTGINSWSWDAALAAAGAVLTGVDMVMEGRARNAFCPVRPPGHHARPMMGMGFCLFNNIALGAWHAWEKYGLDRILIIDWDGHHGNGTQEAFYDHKQVFFFSIHQDMWYPFTGRKYETGEGEGKGMTMNFPFPAWSDGEDILPCFTEHLVLAMKKYQPQLVLISAGFDALKGDPLVRLGLKVEDFAVMTRIAMDIADKYAGGRLVSVLEGGYSLDGLARCCTAHARELMSS